MPGGLPNLLTLARVAAVPAFAAAFLAPPPAGPWLALALFAAAAATDWLDGWLARRLDAATAFGRFLDPVADKLLVTAALALLAADGRAPVVAVLLVLCREIFVSALREEAARRGAEVPVSRLGKAKTACQMAAILLLLAAGAAPGAGLPAAPIAGAGAALLWAAAALGVASAAGYARRAAAEIRR